MYESYKKKSKVPSQDYLDWLTFGFFITNVNRTIWEPEVVATIYRIRWQIELIFKAWKSRLQITTLIGLNANRIRCILYGRLISITIIQMIYSFADWYTESYLNRETSFHKLVDWLKKDCQLANAIYNKTIDKLLDILCESVPGELLKQRRKRKTTRQLIDEEIRYMESFV